MQTFKRICLRDYPITDGLKCFTLQRGHEYTTSAERDGQVQVFSTYWVWVEASLFAGAEEFTKAEPAKCSACGGSGIDKRHGLPPSRVAIDAHATPGTPRTRL